MTSIRTEAATQLEELAAEVARLAAHVADLQQTQAERIQGSDGEDRPPLYSSVEDWVTTYLLPTFPRPVGEVGMTRWHWSRTELGLHATDLLRDLDRRCCKAEEDLDRVAWRLPPGVIHGDAHTGNVLLPAAGQGRPAPSGPLLCDLDGMCIGPREWDLVPTAHGATRFGRAPADYQGFAEAYQFDVTAWTGWPVLRRVRELQLVTSTIDRLAGRPDVARELAHRLRSLLTEDLGATWTRYR
ncbi:phosphotransferase [Micromonospora orduensis]|uniref:phosphotransferase n=1 Tax=Micromonospora orduensis TaxID=1420891 RepID=UPI0033D6BAF5